MGVRRRLACCGVHSRRDSHGGVQWTAERHRRNTDGSTDRGYWQINSIHGALSTYDAEGNARAAVQLSGNGTDWSPWVTYNTDAYQGKC